MDGQDWLEQGHGDGDGLRPMIKGSSAAGARASIRQTLRGGDASTGRRRVRRRTKALVGWMLYCLTAVGGTAAAWTVRETLFPALGAPTQRSTLESPATEPRPRGTTDDAADPTGDDDISVLTARVVADSSLEPTTVSASLVPGAPAATDDNHGGDGAVPHTGTTVASSGPSGGNGPGAAPVTTVDRHQPGGTTASSTPNSESSTPASVEPPHTSATAPASSSPVTTSSTPADTASGQNGKGSGGGSGGGGSNTSVP